MFYLLLFRLFFEVSKVYAGVLFAQLLCGASFIAASLFQMDMVNKLFLICSKNFFSFFLSFYSLLYYQLFCLVFYFSCRPFIISISISMHMWMLSCSALPIYICIVMQVLQSQLIAWNIRKHSSKRTGI